MQAKVSIVKCDDYHPDKVFAAVKKSLDLIGFKGIAKGSKVLIKPNLLAQKGPDTAVCTHPAVIDAIIRYFKPKKVKLSIGDSSGIRAYGGTLKAFEASGIKAVAEKHGIKIVPFERNPSVKLENYDGEVLKTINVSEAVMQADFIINVPKLKTHALTQYTGAIKNMFGIIPGGAKTRCHLLAPSADSFANLILDVYQTFPPQLTIMDGIVGMEGNGPSSGKPIKTGIIMASNNAVALDMIATKIIGFNSLKIPTLKHAVLRNLCPEHIETLGEKDFFLDYKKPSTINVPPFLQRLVTNIILTKPNVHNDKCKRCGVCVTACPSGAMRMRDFPRISRGKCILCYCCYEMCPHEAISLNRWQK